MFAKSRYLIILVVLFACQNEFFPEGLYDYQVERLLSGGESKVWRQVISDQNCSDSVRLLISLIPSNTDDSLSVSEIFRGSTCAPDTIELGNADASSFSDAIIFTDSLNFSDGNFWTIQSITSNKLHLTRSSQSITLTFP